MPRKKLFGQSPAADALVDAAIVDLKRLGAVIVDPADIATLGETDESEFEVLLYEFKADLNAYLAGLGAKTPYKTLKDLIRFNEENRDREMPYFGQEIFEKAEAKGPLTEKAYLDALEKDLRADAPGGHRQDDGRAPARRARRADERPRDADRSRQRRLRSGWELVLPGDRRVSRCLDSLRLERSACPSACRSSAGAWSEPTLLRIAYAYEQATRHRRPPKFLATAELGPLGGG